MHKKENIYLGNLCRIFYWQVTNQDDMEEGLAVIRQRLHGIDLSTKVSVKIDGEDTFLRFEKPLRVPSVGRSLPLKGSLHGEDGQAAKLITVLKDGTVFM